ncbi:MAG: transporter substrate-binding domain-containing protein [archaeon]
MKKKFQLIVFLFFLLLIFGCSKSTVQTEEQQTADRSLLNVKERGKLVVGISPPSEPSIYKNESTGEYYGFEIEIIKEIASGINVPFELKTYLWEDFFEAAKSGDVDFIITTITITSERSKEMLFSVPYFDAGQVITVRKDNEDIKIPEDLKGKKVGVGGGTTGEQIVLKYVDNSSVIRFENNDPTIEALKKGVIDARVLDYMLSMSDEKNNPELKIVGEPFTQEYYGIATKLGNDALMNEINRVLREMKRTGKMKEIKDRWLK